MSRIFILTIFLCGLISGCAQTAPSGSADSGSVDDNNIVNMVQLRLSEDPTTSRLGLGIESSDGIVTISGRIDNAARRMRAIGIARSVPGVRGVIDKTVQF